MPSRLGVMTSLRPIKAFLTGVRNFFRAPPEEEIDQAFLQQYIDTGNILEKPAETCTAGQHPFGRRAVTWDSQKEATSLLPAASEASVSLTNIEGCNSMEGPIPVFTRRSSTAISLDTQPAAPKSRPQSTTTTARPTSANRLQRTDTVSVMAQIGAATVIQRSFRRFKACKPAKAQLKTMTAEVSRHQEEAALTIQRYVRRTIATRKVSTMRDAARWPRVCTESPGAAQLIGANLVLEHSLEKMAVDRSALQTELKLLWERVALLQDYQELLQAAVAHNRAKAERESERANAAEAAALEQRCALQASEDTAQRLMAEMEFLADAAADAAVGSGSASQPMQPSAQSNQPAPEAAGDNTALVAEVDQLRAALEQSKTGSAAQIYQIAQLRAALDRAEAGRAAADRRLGISLRAAAVRKERQVAINRLHAVGTMLTLEERLRLEDRTGQLDLDIAAITISEVQLGIWVA